MIEHMTMTFYPHPDAAHAVANANSEADPDWTYLVVEGEHGFVVRILDEDGEIVGTL